jgi:hypothetical protein
MEHPRVTRNPNHNIWNNNGIWWIHYTVHLPDYTKKRLRQSLKTKSVAEARRRRNALFRDLRIESEPFALAA